MAKVDCSLQKGIKQHLGVTTWDTLTLRCCEGITELQRPTSLSLPSFAESHYVQETEFDVSHCVSPLYNSYSVLMVSERGVRGHLSAILKWRALVVNPVKSLSN